MHHVLLFVLSLWHCYALAAPWLIIALIPSVIVGLTQFPKAGGAVSVLKRILNYLSVVAHRDSPGTLKAPFTMSRAPLGPTPPNAMCCPTGAVSTVAMMGPAAHHDAPPARAVRNCDSERHPNHAHAGDGTRKVKIAGRRGRPSRTGS